MSFLIASPEALAATATYLTGIGSAISAANAVAAAPTTEILAAGTDEVSTAISALFGAHAQAYQALSAHVAAFHDQFVHTLTAGAGSYMAGRLCRLCSWSCSTPSMHPPWRCWDAR
ncbi:pe_pgrs 33 [Mycobacterium tuberculosis]|nr:pe_pgrs 33 [Mycobacterium tuberculosis]